MSLKLPYDFLTRKLVMRFGPTEHGDGPRRGGDWRIFSSGPGVYVALVVQRALGVRRRFVKRLVK
jgi:cellobiose phosphorylase